MQSLDECTLVIEFLGCAFGISSLTCGPFPDGGCSLQDSLAISDEHKLSGIRCRLRKLID